MGEGRPEIEQVANRVFEDASFAQQILAGKEDYPEIRDAILADLAEARRLEVDELVRTADPARNHQVLADYIKDGPKPGGMHVQHIIDRAQCW